MSLGLLCSTGSRPTSKAGMGTNGDGMGTAWGQKRNEGRIDDKESVRKRARKLLAQAGAADAEDKVSEADIDELWDLLLKHASR